ncbi:hypothetical protein ABZW47_23565 [Streptomyces sp. NPDC004549]|uniref:hypothetical protein n=1 Tax=Streptomyces sp. NPDC004549 TaxID=3154283 RepID=UPI0033A8ED74
MSKLIVRAASAAASVAIAGCALLAAGGSAAAATAPVDGHGPRVTVAEHTVGHDSHDSSWTRIVLDSRYYPWVYDQLVQFCDDEMPHR